MKIRSHLTDVARLGHRMNLEATSIFETAFLIRAGNFQRTFSQIVLESTFELKCLSTNEQVKSHKAMAGTRAYCQHERLCCCFVLKTKAANLFLEWKYPEIGLLPLKRTGNGKLSVTLKILTRQPQRALQSYCSFHRHMYVCT